MFLDLKAKQTKPGGPRKQLPGTAVTRLRSAASLFMHSVCSTRPAFPEILRPRTCSRNRCHKFKVRFRRQFFVPMHASTSNVFAFGVRRQSMTFDVHRHSAFGAKNWRRIWAYGTDFWSRFLQRVSGALECVFLQNTWIFLTHIGHYVRVYMT